ncbi:GntR family transcriptional regulator [Thalassobacillus devorans]|uniref:GntR family transcriptional regulator n=1 Tax=Thalassobacillus devorans TaxID=279813 RepID=A0ABQ1P4J1_9BACI|nr:GntR family transcriptional regulator [Thalassobacillus devorans]NIK29557.1 GntR family transcriptional regulator [Thalassobacillus devorans]GGC91000.1 GntR family transcriptional regulator [Thalassobacillus devorans]
MFDLDLRSRKPIYEQLVEKFKELIIKEVLQADEKLPSVRTLARQMTINPNTIQKAYRELETQGYIYSVKGKGSFVQVSDDAVNQEELMKIKEKLTADISEALYLGMTRTEIEQLIKEAEESIGGQKTND